MAVDMNKNEATVCCDCGEVYDRSIQNNWCPHDPAKADRPTTDELLLYSPENLKGDISRLSNSTYKERRQQVDAVCDRFKGGEDAEEQE